jgi:hypothetical protein
MKTSSQKPTREDGFSNEHEHSKSNSKSNNNNKSKTNMLKSTCNIVLTTDICPNALLENDDGCMTHTYTFSPDQV